MKERGVIMTAEEVRATLDGSKTQVRRPVDMRVPMGYIGPKGCLDDPDCWGFQAEDSMWYVLGRGHNDRCYGGDISIAPPLGDVGDLLYVRETLARVYKGDPPHSEDAPLIIEYKADTGNKYPGYWPDDAGDDPECGRWRSSASMPRWASRINLKIIDVRVEQLQTISEADAIQEGLRKLSKDGGRTWKFGIADRDGLPGTDNIGWPWREWSQDHRVAFAKYWDSKNSKRAPWESNPWVWVYEFRRIKP